MLFAEVADPLIGATALRIPLPGVFHRLVGLSHGVCGRAIRRLEPLLEQNLVIARRVFQ